MREKTHGRSELRRHEIGALLELLRRLVAEGRMQVHAVILAVDDSDPDRGMRWHRFPSA
jgi:hypothetical protein